VGIIMNNQQSTKINSGDGAPQTPKENESAETPVKVDIEQQTPRKSEEDSRKKIFGRLSVQISPPKETSTPAARKPSPGNMSILEYKWDHDKHRTVKKRRLEETSLEKELVEVEKARTLLVRKYKQLLPRLGILPKALCQIVRENHNTNRKIKEVSNKLESTVSQMTTEEMQELLHMLGQGEKGKRHLKHQHRIARHAKESTRRSRRH
jgi:hypothetical protein